MNLRDYIEFSKSGGWFFSEDDTLNKILSSFNSFEDEEEI